MVDYSLYWRISSDPDKLSLTTGIKENLRGAHYMSYLFFPFYGVNSCEDPLLECEVGNYRYIERKLYPLYHTQYCITMTLSPQPQALFPLYHLPSANVID
jgi:hypothetical protein